MTDYKQLCEDLRFHADFFSSHAEKFVMWKLGKLIVQAADAIEKQQLRIAELERSYDKMAKDLAFRTEQAEQLQAENEQLRQKYIRSETDATNLTGECVILQAENERLKKQLEAAVDDIPHDCEMCKNNNPNCLAICCHTCGQKNCKCKGCTTKNYKWRWRRDTDRS